MRILIVEDDEFTASVLRQILKAQNYAVEVARDGQAGKELAIAFPYDLLLLSVELPQLDGISLCRDLRSLGYTLPILLLTGCSSSHEKAVGLDAGADDYLVKPFDPEELVARVRALLRRRGTLTLPILKWGRLRLDPSICEVSYQGQPLPLTPKEYALLELLLRNPRQVFSCGAILEHLWCYEDAPGEEAVRTHIKGLRQKLKTAHAPPELIQTVYGIGYRLQPLKLERQPIAVAADSGPSTSIPARQRRSQPDCACHQLQRQPASVEVREPCQEQFQPQVAVRATPSPKLAPASEVISPAAAIPLPEAQRPRLLVIDRDRPWAAALTTAANTNGLEVVTATDLSIARSLISETPPAIVLFDPAIAPEREGWALLQDLNHHMPTLPVMVLTEQDSLPNRLLVARSERQVFLHKPLAADQVLELVLQVLSSSLVSGTATSVIKVLLVDTDHRWLAQVRSHLQRCGLQVKLLTDPRQFWTTLEAIAPDLLMLGLELPYLNGIDLCRTVRNDCRWWSLPIVILTTHHPDAETLNQVFASGADDLLTRSIMLPDLTLRILNRLQRFQYLRK